MSEHATTRTIEAADVPAPGAIAAFAFGELRVALANVSGDLFAFEDGCTHEACSLSEEGELDGYVVICGCHGGSFDVRSGEPVDGPVFDPLRTFRVVQDADGVRVGLGESAEPPA